MPNPPRPYDIDDPADLARLFREARGYLRVSLDHGTDWEGRRFAMAAFEVLIGRMEGKPAAPKPCEKCHGDRTVRMPTDHGEWDDIPCSLCNPHDMFGRPLETKDA